MDNVWVNGTVLGPADNFYSLTDPRLTNLFRGHHQMIGYGSNVAVPLSMNTPADYVCAWEKCPPLVAIISSLAKMDYNGRIVFYKPGKEEEIKPNGYNRDVKALADLFARPNPLQTWPEFRAQQNIYKRLFGICPVLTVKPVGFNIPKMMWNIPPHISKITTSGKLYYQTEAGKIITRFQVSVNGEDKDLPVEDMIFLRDNTVSLSSEWLPDSRLKTIQWPISNVVAAYEAENVLVTKRGALGIFSNTGRDSFGTVLIDPDQKDQLQADLSGYGLTHSQSQYIVTTASLSWQQIGVNPKDLMLIETRKAATEAICDVMGYRFELLANERGTTFENQKEAKASVYQNTIIPECDADFQVYNNYFAAMGIPFEAWCDYSHVEELQKSQLTAAQERKANNDAFLIEYEAGLITMDDWREKNGEERMDVEPFTLYKWQMEKYRTDNGLTVVDNQNVNNESGTAQDQ